MPSEVQPMELDSTTLPASVPPEMESLTFEDVKEQCRQIERAEITKDFQLIKRVLRSLVTTRHRITNNVLWRLVNFYFIGSAASKLKSDLICYLKMPDSLPQLQQPPPKSPKLPKRPSSTSVTTTLEASSRPSANKKPESPKVQQKKLTPAEKYSLSLLPEVESYLHLLVVLFLMRENRLDEAENCINLMMNRLEDQNRRSLDPLASKAYYFYSVIYDKAGKLSKCIQFFYHRLRVATLHHDEDSQATLINCLLRIHIETKQYETAQFLIKKANFPINSNANEWARYHYYVAKIRTVEMQYVEAKEALQLALRQAPQRTAVGFKQSVQKLLVTVELLLGEIPERSIFRQAIYRKALIPYLQLTQAVRTGDLQRFDETLKVDESKFERDSTLPLCHRLRQNVIKTAVRRISLAYSKIGLNDVQKKLQLPQIDDAEYILNKAIKDGVIDAEVNHHDGYVRFKECGDLYSTSIPQKEYHMRIKFCLDIYNQAVKAMRFPQKSYAKELETNEEKREREQQELDFAKEMAEVDDDQDDEF